MKRHLPKSVRRHRPAGWLGFAAACLLALAMAVGVASAVYGNFDYDFIFVHSYQQTIQKVQAIEAGSSDSLVSKKIESILR